MELELKHENKGLEQCRYVQGLVEKEFCNGKSCNRCRKGYYDLADKSLYLSYNSFTIQEKIKHKKNRFLIRCLLGVETGLAKGYLFRWFVLTESDEALKNKINFGKEFNKFNVWLRYHCKDYQYMVVEHEQGVASKITGKARHNYHVLTYGSDKLPVKEMREYWLKHYKSTITGMALIADISKAVYYLAGYLSDKEKFIRAWCSRGWIYHGVIGYSKKYKKQNDVYPDRQHLINLALMSTPKRKLAEEYLLEMRQMEYSIDTKLLRRLLYENADILSQKYTKDNSEQAVLRYVDFPKDGKEGEVTTDEACKI